MTRADLLAHLHAVGARLWLDNERVRVSAPQGAISEVLWEQLADRKDELRDWLLSRQAGAPARESLAPRPRPRRLPLSCAQRRLWFIDRLNGSSAEYNMVEARRLRGSLNRDALERTVQAIVNRHEVLRTHFLEEDGEPFQNILPDVGVEIPFEDLGVCEEAAQRSAITSALRREWEQPFDLTRGPVFRFKLFRLGPYEHVLLRTVHHIAFDGWSTGVFNREFGTFYNAFSAGFDDPLEPLSVQYADFALWERDWLGGVTVKRGLEYLDFTACRRPRMPGTADGPSTSRCADILRGALPASLSPSALGAASPTK